MRARCSQLEWPLVFSTAHNAVVRLGQIIKHRPDLFPTSVSRSGNAGGAQSLDSQQVIEALRFILPASAPQLFVLEISQNLNLKIDSKGDKITGNAQGLRTSPPAVLYGVTMHPILVQILLRKYSRKANF